jgi:hypothetical protein
MVLLLQASGNQIPDLRSLAHLEKKTKLETVYLEGNPCETNDRGGYRRKVRRTALLPVMPRSCHCAEPPAIRDPHARDAGHPRPSSAQAGRCDFRPLETPSRRGRPGPSFLRPRSRTHDISWTLLLIDPQTGEPEWNGMVYDGRGM